MDQAFESSVTPQLSPLPEGLRPEWERVRRAVLCQGEPDWVPLMELGLNRVHKRRVLGRPVRTLADDLEVSNLLGLPLLVINVGLHTHGAVLDAMAAANMTIEINCSGWDKPVKEAYPSLFYLQEANRRNIPLIINSDAHTSNNVAYNFEHGHRLALEAGYTELARYEGRKRFLYPL